jgi:acetyltransferase
MGAPGCESVAAGLPPGEGAEIIHFSGRRVCLRGLQAEDRPLLQEFLAQIDSYDLQMRFFAGFRSVPPTLLDFLMRVDREHRTVLVAIDDRRRGQAQILAVAHAHAHPGGETAEIALLVRSDLKGIGFGSLLLDRLITQCRDRGVARLEADVLRQNARMLRLARRYGFRKEAAEGGTVRLALELTSVAA